MTPERQARLQACLQELAAILYEETNAAERREPGKHRKNRALANVRTR